MRSLDSIDQNLHKGYTDYTRWKEASALIVHSANTMETERGAIGSGVVTPSDRLFVRNNLSAPTEGITNDPDAEQISAVAHYVAKITSKK